MIRTTANPVGQQIKTLWSSGTLTGLRDDQLLARFSGAKDALAESAFRELMHRHGPMVMGVCRQILRRPHDADDAFQATFLVLVRKSGSIRVGDSLAPWLYSVAFRTAHRARAISYRYRQLPDENLEVPAEGSTTDPCQFDLRPLLHEELNRLPDKYREPIVLCHLEGKSHEEAARLLHWPVGTVSGRLSRGRELLRSRLKRRGIEVSPAVLVANWIAETPLGIAPSLAQTTAGGAIGPSAHAISASVQSLARGVQKSMLLSKLSLTAVVVVLVGGMVTGAAVWGIQPSQATTPPIQAEKPNALPQDAQFKEAISPKDAVRPQPVPTTGAANVLLQPGRNKNSPNIDIRRGFPGVRTSSMVLVESPDRTAWQALSLVKDFPHAGNLDKVQPGWMRVDLSLGTTAEPIRGGSGDLAALAIKGKTIDQIAVFSAEFGIWIKQRLLRPVEGEISPYIFGGFVLYQAGNDFYALTAQRPRFGILHLEGAEQTTVSIGTADIEVMQGNRLYVFSPKTCLWSTGVEVHVPPAAASPRGEETPAAHELPQ
jgi:RNA polymerase sigma factor (sigma-70 family)